MGQEKSPPVAGVSAREQAQNYLETDEARKAVATLVEAARLHPEDRAVGAMIYSSIRDHVWHLPQTLPILHDAPVRVLTFSQDASHLATGTESGIVLVSTTEPLDEEDAKDRRIQLKQKGAIRGLFYSTDGKRLAVASVEDGLKVWDLETRKIVFEGPKPASPVTTFSTNRAAELVAIGTEAGVLQVIEVATGKVRSQLDLNAKIVDQAISVDGTRIVVATGDLMVRVSDTSTGKPVGGQMRRATAIASVYFSRDGRSFLVAETGGIVALAETESNAPIIQPVNCGTGIKKARLSPDGTRIAVMLDDGSVHFWDGETGKEMPVDLREDGQFNDMQWSRTGLRMATASDGNHATLWSSRDGTRWGEMLPHEAPVLALSFSGDGKLLATGCSDGKVRIWRTDGGKAMPTVRAHSARARTAFYSLDGEHLVTTSEDHTALQWISGQVRPYGPALKHKGKVTCGTFDAEATRVLTSDDTGVAQLWTVETGRPDGAPFRHPGPVNWVDFHPDSLRFVAVSGASAYVWSISRREKPLAVITHPGGGKSEMKGARFSPDGKWLATASTDGTARIWDTRTYKSATEPIKRGFPVLCVRFSPDSSRLVVAGEDGQAAVYETSTWKLVGTPILLPGPVFSAAITGDNLFLVACSFLQNAVQFFEIETGRALGRAPTVPSQATCVDYHLQDQVVTVACDDGTVRAFGGPFVLQDVPAWACGFAERIAGLRKTGPESFERVESHYGQLANYVSGGAKAGNASFAQLVRWKMTMGTGRTGMPRFVSTIGANVERRVDERSVDALYECYEAAPGYPLVLAALSAYMPPGRQPEFLADLVVKNKATEPLARAFAASALINVGREADAKKVMADAVAAAPDDPKVIRRAAKLNARLKNKDLAIQQFEKALTADPNDFETRRSYGWALYNLNEPAKAAAQFKVAQDLTGDLNSDLIAGLCLCASAAKNAKEAQTSFRQLVNIDSSWKEASYIASLTGWTTRELAALEGIRRAAFSGKR